MKEPSVEIYLYLSKYTLNMVEEREGEGYRQVSLPGGLYKRIEDKVASSKGDFKSVADYVKYVLRRSMEGDETGNGLSHDTGDVPQ